MEWRASTVSVLLLALTGIQVNSTMVYPSNHVNSICSMWGDFHFKTFDGDVYQFPGMCEYNLVSDCQSLIHQFSVHVKRTENSTGPKISRVLITINDIGVELTEKQVLVNEEKVKLPVQLAGILVEENTIYTRLYSKMGITVKWNKNDAVMVELDSKYSNRTCGLCGDFNGVPVYNEFIDSGRRLGYVEFGNKHRVRNPMHACEDPFENVDEKNVVNKCEKVQTDCADLLKDEKWSSCRWVLNPEPYIKACTNDICSRQTKDKDSKTSAICASLSEYSRLCSHAGGAPPNWRTAAFCAVTCPYNMVHSESGSPCMDTCSHQNTNSLCEEHNTDGCFCPPGTVFDDISNKGCIPSERCKCKHDHIYNTGEILHKDEGECVCEEGEWVCTSIPRPGLCSLEEGSHFTTFDGKEFTFNGDCHYVLSKDCNQTKFSILGEIAPCYTRQTDTCLKSVVVLFYNDIKNPLIIKADGSVQHNADILLPYITADFTVFMPSSFHVMLQTTFGLQVQIQLVPLMQVYITVDQNLQGKTCGLCGNFNKVLSDDLKTPQGVVEGTPVSFANSWKSSFNCPDRTERMDDPCSYSSDSENFAQHWCSKMQDKESLFAKCHTTVNPESYYKRCKYSSCSCEKSEDCLCAVVSSYVRACAAKGISLQGWRKIVCEKYTKNCPASQNYSYQLQTCQRTCLSLASERQSCSVDFVPVDGCACPDGLYQDENGLCVPSEKCPCFHTGQKINPGKSITVRDEHCICIKGKLHCHSWKNQTQVCSSPKVFFNCSTAAPDEYGLECAKTCSQQKVDCFSEHCQSGCQCPSGLLDDGIGHCVKPDNCPCKHNGQFYKQGSTITTDCNKCTCQGGKWKCTHYKCPGICTIYGSGHYRTFDQQRFGFSGGCSYIAAQNNCGNKTGNFYVITENMPCGTTGTTCSKAVKILLGRTMLLLSGGTVTATDTKSGPDIRYTERNFGMYLVIDANIGLTILWDRKTTVRIILQPQHMEDVCGLCGNFNGDAKDDFTTQGNLPTTNAMEFVDSWKVLSSCPDAKPDFNPCVETPNRENWAKIQCSIIKDIKGPFKACHNKVDQNPYYDNCVKDSCACDTGGDCECLCTAVAAYAQACNEADVCVNWRTPEFCPVYCDYYNTGTDDCTWHYSPCHTSCYKTCLNPNATCDNNLPNLEGCYPKCPEDKPIFDEKNRICVEECILTTTPKPSTSSFPTPKTTTKPTTTTPEPTRPSSPITTTITFTSTSNKSTTSCIICGWSDWFNVYNPDLGGGNDLETYKNIAEHGKEICKEPIGVECRSVKNSNMSFEDFINKSKQVAQCNVSYGLECKKDKQKDRPFKCFDYEIRVYCCIPCSPTTTPTATTKSFTTTPKHTTPSSPTPTTTTKSTTTTTPKPTTPSSPTSTTATKSSTKPIHTTPSTPTPTVTTKPTTTPKHTTPSSPTPTTTTKSTTTPKATTPSTPTSTATTESIATTSKYTTSSSPTPKTTTKPTTTTPEPTRPSSPITTTITFTSTSNKSTTSCIICGWSDWFNVYNPDLGGGNDLETYKNIAEHGKEICKEPIGVECRSVKNSNMSFEDFINKSKQVAQCNVSYGLECKKDQQKDRPFKCFDYEIRVYCCIPCSPTTTPTATTKSFTTTPKHTTPSSPTPTTTTKSTTTTIQSSAAQTTKSITTPTATAPSTPTSTITTKSTTTTTTSKPTTPSTPTSTTTTKSTTTTTPKPTTPSSPTSTTATKSSTKPIHTTPSTPTPTVTTKPTTTPKHTTPSSPTPTTTTKSTTTPNATTPSTPTSTATTESIATTSKYTTSSSPTPTTTTKYTTTTPKYTTASSPSPTATTKSTSTTIQSSAAQTTKSITTPTATAPSTPTSTITTKSTTTTTTSKPTTPSTPTSTATTKSTTTTTSKSTTPSSPTATATTKSTTTTPKHTTPSSPTPTVTTKSTSTTIPSSAAQTTKSIITPTATTPSTPTSTITTKSTTTTTSRPTTPSTSTSTTTTKSTTTLIPTTPSTPTPTATKKTTTTPKHTTPNSPTPTTTTKSSTTPKLTTPTSPTLTTTTKSTTPKLTTPSSPTPTATTKSTTTPKHTTPTSPTPTTTTKSTTTPKLTTPSSPTPTATTKTTSTTITSSAAQTTKSITTQTATTPSTPTSTITTKSTTTTTPKPTTPSTPTSTATTKSITTTPKLTTPTSPTAIATTKSTTPKLTTTSTPTQTATTKSTTKTSQTITTSSSTTFFLITGTTTHFPQKVNTTTPNSTTPIPTSTSTATAKSTSMTTKPPTPSSPTPTATTKSTTTTPPTPKLTTPSSPTTTATTKSTTTTPKHTTPSSPTPTTTKSTSTTIPSSAAQTTKSITTQTATTPSTPTSTSTTKSTTTTPKPTTPSTPTSTATTKSITTTPKLTTPTSPTAITTTKSTTPKLTTPSTPTPTATTKSTTTKPPTPKYTTPTSPTPTTITKSTTTPKLTTPSSPTPTATTKTTSTTIPSSAAQTTKSITTQTATTPSTPTSTITTKSTTTTTPKPTTPSTPTSTATTKSITTTPKLTTPTSPTPITTTKSTTPKLTTPSSPTTTATTKSTTTTPKHTTPSSPTPTTTTKSTSTTIPSSTAQTTKSITTQTATTPSTPTPTATTKSTTGTPKPTTQSSPTPTATTKSTTTTPPTPKYTTPTSPTHTTTTKSTTTPKLTTPSSPTPTATTKTTSTTIPSSAAQTTKSITTQTATTPSTPTSTITTKSTTTTTPKPTTPSTPTSTATTTPKSTTSSSPTSTATTTQKPTTPSTPTPTVSTKSTTTTPNPTTSSSPTPTATTTSTKTQKPTILPSPTPTTKSTTTTPKATTPSSPTSTSTTKSITTSKPTVQSSPTPTSTIKSTIRTAKPTTPSPPTTTPGHTTSTRSISTTTATPPDCPEWAKNTNETFYLCKCMMARCIKDNNIEVIPFQCPPLQNITCENGKKPVLVEDEYGCCKYYACDCFCEGWGDPHYKTFDGKFYSHQGNCTYTLMEEIRPQTHLKIYIDSVYCDLVEHVSCPRSIIVSYNKLVIKLTNHNLLGGADLEAFENNVKLRLPYAYNGVRVISSSLDLFLSIPLLGVNISFGATGFGINLPFQHFGNNTQGHCGTCNNNKADDCMIPGGILVDDCAVMADYWPASGVNGEVCTPPSALPSVPVKNELPSKQCKGHPDCYLLNNELFKACHSHIPPQNFILSCQYDSCHMGNPAVVCISLQTYARACLQLGICINWRNYTKLCNIECPADKVFNPCGPAEPPTCADIPEEKNIKMRTEGCFCPEGTLLFNKNTNVCVNKCGCLDSSKIPRDFGEVFEYNCEECICEKNSKSVSCKPKACLDVSTEICTEPGFVLVNVTNPSDPCCSKQVCNCDVSMCPPMDKKCPIGYNPVVKVPDGKCCPEIKCEPKKVCVYKNMVYEPGTNIPKDGCQECRCTLDVDPKTQLFMTKCQSVKCIEKCDPGYENIKKKPDDCCGECVKTHCIVSINGVDHTLKEGETFPSTNQGCDRITCTKINGQFITNKYTVQCPPFNISNCQPGTVQLSSDGCCNVCVDQVKGCRVQTVRKYIQQKDCVSEKKMDLTFCSGDCSSFGRYSEPELSSCTCCQATQTSNRTVTLGCVNGNIITHTYVNAEKCACSKANCHREDVGKTLTEDKK